MPQATLGRGKSSAIALLVCALTVAASVPAAARPRGQDSEQWISSTMAGMSLEEKVGQLFIPYVTGATVNSVSEDNVNRFGVATPAEVVAGFDFGGIVYFAASGNTVEPHQIAALSNGLQRANSEAGNTVPLSIVTDQETGLISRIGSPATVFPGAMALGAARAPRLTASTYTITGRELRALGVTTDYAPVADVNVNPANPVIGVRSFGSRPDLVAALVPAAVKALQGEKVSATAKHFPGHGDTSVDSHTALPVITHTVQEWEQIDAPPFRAAIAAGVDAIMTAHISFPALDPTGDPSTLSRPILTGLLRDTMGFQGVIVTDSLRMDGVRLLYGDAEVAIRAVEAGADILLDPPAPRLQLQAVIDAVRSGRLTEARIEESVRRILTMKWNRAVIASPYVDEARVDGLVGTRTHLREAQRITDRTTTLVTDVANLVPLPRGSAFVTGWGDTQVPQLAAGLADRRRAVASLVTGLRPSGQQVADAVAQATAHDLVIVTTYSAWKYPQQQDLVTALRATGKPVLVVALRDPYDIAVLDGIESYLATYSPNAVAIESALRVIRGQNPARGLLPVDVVDPAAPDTIVHPFGTGLRR